MLAELCAERELVTGNFQSRKKDINKYTKIREISSDFVLINTVLKIRLSRYEGTVFINLDNNYDRIDRNPMWKAQLHKVRGRLGETVKSLWDNSKGCVRGYRDENRREIDSIKEKEMDI